VRERITSHEAIEHQSREPKPCQEGRQGTVQESKRDAVTSRKRSRQSVVNSNKPDALSCTGPDRACSSDREGMQFTSKNHTNCHEMPKPTHHQTQALIWGPREGDETERVWTSPRHSTPYAISNLQDKTSYSSTSGPAF